MSDFEVVNSAQLNSTRKQIAILDFGSQYSHLIARRVRELNVFCELYSCLVEASVLSLNNIVGIILSGGPSSVYDTDSPHLSESVWQYIEALNIPVLGICYGMQEIAHRFGGEVLPSSQREFGRVSLDISEEHLETANLLFEGVNHPQMWMSHGDKVVKLPVAFVNIASTSNSPNAAIANLSKKMFGLQFHPEVTHSLHGKEILKNFAQKVCHAPNDWNMFNIADEFICEVFKVFIFFIYFYFSIFTVMIYNVIINHNTSSLENKIL
jgi:GMP synthase (glutamine-hydrolysing)